MLEHALRSLAGMTDKSRRKLGSRRENPKEPAVRASGAECLVEHARETKGELRRAHTVALMRCAG